MADKHEREYQKYWAKQLAEAEEKLSGISLTIYGRLKGAKDRLSALGYDCPSVEIGLKVLGNYGPTFWGSINLGSPVNLIERYTHASLDDVLDSIDASIANIPEAAAILSDTKEALAKLSPRERDLLGVQSVNSMRSR